MTTKTAGHATPPATQKFAERMRAQYPTFEPSAYRPLTDTGLIASKIGYGSYRVHSESDEHVETLKSAIEAGCNLIDTSSNYTDGGSEALIGNVLKALISEEKIRREEIIVVSKVGYMQGQNLDEATRRESSGQAWSEVVKYMEGCWHCIHPDFLADQWERSTERLGVETIDVYLLHNPEYFLSDAKKRTPRGNLQKLRDTYYDRIYRAFVQMEQFVSEGKICYYGISSNTFPSPETDFEHTSLNRVYEAAVSAAETVHSNGDANHFKVLQLPYNLLEHAALTAVNNRIDGNGVTVLEAAKSLGIGVLVNRPLNAFKYNRMNRLAHYPHDSSIDYQAAIASAVDSLQAEEDRLRKTLTDWGILRQVESAVNLDLFYNLAEKLPQFLPRIQSREHWEQIARQYIIPQVNAYLLQTTRSCPDPKSDAWETASNEHVETINGLLSLVTGDFNRAASEEVDWIREALDAHLSEDERKLTFSQKALNFVAGSPGVSVVLNGMKRREYVTDAMGIMAVPDFSTPAVELVEGVEQ